MTVEAELDKESEQIPLEFTGSIPDWLQGTFVRNGPINVKVNGVEQCHWLDGLAMLHAFRMDQGKIFYTNQFLKTDAYETVFKKESLSYLGFACDPCHVRFRKLFSFFFPTDTKIPNANINVTKLADQYVALYETPLPVVFDPKTLKTLGLFDYQDQLPHDNCWESAHPHDSLDGSMINYIVEYGYHSFYTIYVINKGEKGRRIIAKVPVDKPSYMHSFSLTENFILLTQYPLRVNPLKFMLSGKPFIKNYYWDETLGTEFLLIDRKSGQVHSRYKTASFFAFHHVNAYEKGNEVILDIIQYPDAAIIDTLSDPLFDAETSLVRYTLTKNSENVKKEVLYKATIELPRINSNYDSKPYKYAYFSNPADPKSADDTRPIYKWDHSTNRYQTWQEIGCYPGEPVFAAAPNGSKEDDGVILSIVIDERNKGSFLLIIDATSFKEIGRAKTPYLIPKGLHGKFFKTNIK